MNGNGPPRRELALLLGKLVQEPVQVADGAGGERFGSRRKTDRAGHAVMQRDVAAAGQVDHNFKEWFPRRLCRGVDENVSAGKLGATLQATS